MTAVLWFAVSFGGYLLDRSGESLQARAATWARDHHLGALVDRVEQWQYSKPPSSDPAATLSVDGAPTSDSIAGPPPPTSTVVPAYAPADLTPVLAKALRGEGRWKVRRDVDGHAVLWVTGLRPLRSAPSVTATFAVIDQDLTRAALFNGPEIPGGKGFRRGRRIPQSLLPYAIAAHNGGFRREHSQGGYFTEDREIWKLRDGAASIVVRADGRVDIGRWGRDFLSTDGLVSVRQNLRLLVDGGKPQARSGEFGWGAWKDGNLFIVRSAACVRTDGRFLFAIAGLLDAAQFARALVYAGCDRAIQLDVNAAWPKFFVFDEGVPSRVDRRVTGPQDLYVRGSSKEFFVFFQRDLPDAQAALLR